MSMIRAKPTPASSPTLCARLRQQTRPQHEAIERVGALRRLFVPDYELAEYRALLARLYGFYHALEPGLFTDLPPAALAVLGHRRKSGLLRRDLAALGLGEAVIDTLPMCFRLPPLSGVACRAGVCYVLEGATLGGRVIHRRLITQFGAGVASDFYRGYGERNGREWRAMCAYLDRLGDELTETGRDELVAAAAKTFDCMSAWLSGEGRAAV